MASVVELGLTLNYATITSSRNDGVQYFVLDSALQSLFDLQCQTTNRTRYTSRKLHIQTKFQVQHAFQNHYLR